MYGGSRCLEGHAPAAQQRRQCHRLVADGQTMAFVRSEDPAKGMTVVTADPDGSNQRELVTRRPPKMFFGDVTTQAGRPPSRPAWSPDGELLLLTAYSTDSLGATSELVLLDARTGSGASERSDKGHLVRGGLAGSNSASPSWRNRRIGTWISDLTGNLLAPVTREFGAFANMSLTADRTTVVAKRFSRASGIWVSSGSGADDEVRVRLSPAGAALPILDTAGGLTYTAFKPDGASAIYHLARGTSTPAQIVDRRCSPRAVPGSTSVPTAWTIVYAQLDWPNALYRVVNDGSGRVALVDADSRSPRLAQGGKVLFARRTKSGLFSVPLGGGTVQPLSERVVRRDISVSPDGTRVLFETDKPGIVVLCDLPDCANPKDLSLRSAYWAPDGAGVA